MKRFFGAVMAMVMMLLVSQVVFADISSDASIDTAQKVEAERDDCSMKITTEVIYDLGEFRVVGEKYPIATPHGTAFGFRKYGVTDKYGNSIVEQKFNSISKQIEGRAAFKDEKGNIGFFDEKWNVVIEAKYFSNGPDVYFSEGLAAVGKRHNERYIVWGYIDRDGNEITEFIYDEANPFENGEAWVGIREEVFGGFHTKTKWGKIDKDGNIVQLFKFGYALGRDYEYLWQDPIEVQLSQNLVELNGVIYRNTDIEYPFINYLGYTYMPLTYYGCRKLGIACDWTPEDGVMLSTGGVPSGDIIGNNGMAEGVLEKAVFYKGRLSINGTVFEYGDTAYPLVHYKDIVYIPVCWQNGMDALRIDYTFIGPEHIDDSDRGCMVFRTK